MEDWQKDVMLFFNALRRAAPVLPEHEGPNSPRDTRRSCGWKLPTPSRRCWTLRVRFRSGQESRGLWLTQLVASSTTRFHGVSVVKSSKVRSASKRPVRVIRGRADAVATSRPLAASRSQLYSPVGGLSEGGVLLDEESPRNEFPQRLTNRCSDRLVNQSWESSGLGKAIEQMRQRNLRPHLQLEITHRDRSDRIDDAHIPRIESILGTANYLPLNEVVTITSPGGV